MNNVKIEAKARFVRVSPQKAKIIADVLRGRNVVEALSILQFIYKKAAKDFNKLIRSAVANAVNNNGLNAEELEIIEIRADQGPTYKRYKAGSRGSYEPFKRPTAHLTVVLGNRKLSTDASVLSNKQEETDKENSEKADKKDKEKKKQVIETKKRNKQTSDAKAKKSKTALKKTTKTQSKKRKTVKKAGVNEK
jgi:large subunit ribosomal protein L22